jgi:hypothetical protein
LFEDGIVEYVDRDSRSGLVIELFTVLCHFASRAASATARGRAEIDDSIIRSDHPPAGALEMRASERTWQ